MPQPNNKPPKRVAFLLFGWGTNASKRCYATRSVVELGSHSSRKPSGSSLTSGSAKNPRFCEAKTSTLVPRQSRSEIRFAFTALFVGAFCERPRANAVRPYGQTHSARITEQSGVTLCSFGPVDNVRKANVASLPKANVGRLSLQKILYIFRKICYNKPRKAVEL